MLLTTIAITCPSSTAHASQLIGEVQLLHDAWTFKDGAPGTSSPSRRHPTGSYGWARRRGYSDSMEPGSRHFIRRSAAHLASTNIPRLYAPASGGLWIGYQFGGTSFVNHSVVTNYSGEATGSRTVYGFAQEREAEPSGRHRPAA